MVSISSKGNYLKNQLFHFETGYANNIVRVLPYLNFLISILKFAHFFYFGPLCREHLWHMP